MDGRRWRGGGILFVSLDGVTPVSGVVLNGSDTAWGPPLDVVDEARHAGGGCLSPWEEFADVDFERGFPLEGS
ncbi:hypothetical protein E4U32_005353 [Claviceps aff. humidiphila group G2b]|nr:hypothetical protein E4U32_005353 [Claviceps aff. humidiphila group G2b]